MHNVDISQEIIDRVLKRRGRLHLFDAIDPRHAAFVVVDMQNTFCAEGAPAEVPAARGIVVAINWFATELRRRGGVVVWVTHANQSFGGPGGGSDWDRFFNRFVADDVRRRTIESLRPEGEGQKLWHELKTEPGDVFAIKNRYSALIPGSSPLERILRSRNISTLFIGGTKTNVCCESTARDAMMLNFKTVMITDANAAMTDEDHNASLISFYLVFGDIMSTDFAIACLRRNAGCALAAAE